MRCKDCGREVFLEAPGWVERHNLACLDLGEVGDIIRKPLLAMMEAVDLLETIVVLVEKGFLKPPKMKTGKWDDWMRRSKTVINGVRGT